MVGLVRDRVLTHLFGAGHTLDVYYAAFRIPDFIYNLLIVGALAAGFIPVFTALYEKDKERAWEVTRSIITILGLSILGICGILWFLAPFIMPYLVPGFSLEKMNQTTILTRVLLLSPIILGLSGIAGSVLQSVKAFFFYSLSPILYNIGIILGAIFFVPMLGIAGLAWGVILGASLHLLIQLPLLFQLGFRYRPRLKLNDRPVRQILLAMIPRTLGLATTQINLVVVTILASTLPIGSITVFNLANNLQSFPIGLVGISFAIAAFPTLSSLAANKKPDELIETIGRTTPDFSLSPRLWLFFSSYGRKLRSLFGSGEFDWTATITTKYS